MLTTCACAGSPGPRCRRLFDDGWRFHRGDVDSAWAPGLDDAGWRQVDLPHDWAIEDLPPAEGDPTAPRSGPFDPSAESGGATGFTVGSISWYRKTFTLPEQIVGKRVRIAFDGVYMNARLWLNGHRIGEHAYGYTPFELDLTPHLRLGGEPNVLAVRVDSSGRTSRWYAGSGIYRHVALVVTKPVHVDQWGVFVTTPEVSAEKAMVRSQVAVRNESEVECEVTVGAEVLSASGETVATGASTGTVPPGETRQQIQALAVAAPDLWSPDTPSLYRLVTTVQVAGEVVDRVETPFGIRSITFDPTLGCLLNGRPLKLRGGCVHHDNGPLGARAYDRAEERRVQLLKAGGFNAIRTAHNPPSAAFLDACDRVGMLVMDEAFDCWQRAKNPEDYHRFFDAWWQRDIEAMVLRDRNHPSVILWSIGNEVVEQGDAAGLESGRKLARHVRSLDPTRLVAIGAHPGTDPWENLDGLFAELGLCGYNYKWQRYAPDHERAPRRVIAGTESFPSACFDSWMATIDGSWVVGDFVWTSFDYLGESALGHTRCEGDPNQYALWPWTAANCGDIDICGFRRPQSHYRSAVWGLEPCVSAFIQTPAAPGKTVEIVPEWNWGWHNEWPSWTWPGHEGETLTVRVYSSCPQVRLLHNRADLGTLPTNRETRYTATFKVPYEPGELVALGLDDTGQEVARWELHTAGAPAAIRLTPDRTQLQADGQDLSFVTVELLDEHGVLNPNASDLVQFSVAGPGSIVAAANSDPCSVESFQQPQRTAWRGRCLLVVKAGDEPGELRIAAKAAGLQVAETVVVVS